MGEIIYVRHGQASLFSDNYDQLSEKGYLQSKELGIYLKDHFPYIRKIYCGPLKRHWQTLDQICLSFDKNSLSIIKDERLEEHHGYRALKMLMPRLIMEDNEFKSLVNKPFNNEKEQLRHHFKIYDYFAKNWSRGEYDPLLPDTITPWKIFRERVETFANELLNVESDPILVVTSGGPVSVVTGQMYGWESSPILDYSSKLYNASISLFSQTVVLGDDGMLNYIDYVSDQRLKTLV